MRSTKLQFAALSLAIPLLLQPTSVLSQSSPEAGVIDDLLNCLPIDDDQSRLECYDERLRQVADLRPAGTGDAAQTFTGNGNWQSDPFIMDQEWRLAWQSETDLLTIQLTGPTPLQQKRVVDNQIGSGAGRTPPHEPGEYQINVRAIGAWQIIAIEE